MTDRFYAQTNVSIGVTWRVQGGTNAPPIFFQSKNNFSWLLSRRWAYKKYKHFLNVYLGGVKTEKMKNLRFTGRRIDASESSVYKEKEIL